MRTPTALVLTAASAALLTSLSFSAAASGGLLRVGARNDARATTSLVNHGPGPALRLANRPGAPPLRVSSSRRVAGLNADRVDGWEASRLRTPVIVYHVGGDDDEGPWVVKTFPGLPAGWYVATYRVRVTFEAPADSHADLSIWFTTSTQPEVGRVDGSQAGGVLVLEATALVDARTPVSLRLHSPWAFNTQGSAVDALDSRVTFVPATALRQARTTYSAD
jgi:hypothetical protein